MENTKNAQTTITPCHCQIFDVVPRFKVNGLINGKEVWILTDHLPTAKKIQLDAECNALHSSIYEWTDDGWI